MAENKFVNASIIFIAAVLLAIVLKTLVFLRPFVIALILTLLLMPVIRFSKKKRIPLALSLIALLLIVLVVLGLVAILIVGESRNIDENAIAAYEAQISGSIDSMLAFVSSLSGGINLKELINPGKIGQIAASTVRIIISAIGAIFSELFYVLLFLLFLVPSHKVIEKTMERLLGKSKSKKIKSVLVDIEKSIISYIGAKSLISLGTAFVSAIILMLFGADFVVVFALLIFILNFIPNIGSFIAVVLALAGYVVKFGLCSNLIWLALLLIAVQIFFGNILEPKFFGNRLKLSPIVILLSLFLWYWIWGIIGMILAVPLASIIKIVFEHIDGTKNIAESMS